MAYRLQIDLDSAPPCNTADRMGRWAQIKAKLGWENRVRLMALAAGLPPEPLKRARIVCTRFSSRRPDDENLSQGFKWLIDALVARPERRVVKKGRLTVRPAVPGVLVDDGPEVLERSYRWEYSRTLGVRMEVEEIE